MTKKRFALFAMAILLLCVPAWAGSILEMPIGQGGRVLYGKGPHTILWGQGITISELIDGGKSLDMSWARMFFTTGRSDGWNGNTLLFGPGGEFTIRGCVDGDPHSGACGRRGDVRGVLMTGTFLDVKLIKEGTETILIAQFLEHLNPALAALMKLPDQSEGQFEMILGPGANTRSCFIDNVYGGSMGVLSEPASIAIFAVSLVGLFFVLRTGKRKALAVLPAAASQD